MLASKAASWKSLLNAGAALVLKFKDDSEFRAVKTSRRDLAMVVSKRLHGGTTVSGTMLVSVSGIHRACFITRRFAKVARMAGIEVFVTGGVGGVHRGGQVSALDIFHTFDLLSRTLWMYLPI